MIKRHFWECIKIAGEALDRYLYDWTLIENFLLQNFIEEDFHNWKFGLWSPFYQFDLVFQFLVLDDDLIFLEVLLIVRIQNGLIGVCRKLFHTPHPCDVALYRRNVGRKLFIVLHYCITNYIPTHFIGWNKKTEVFQSFSPIIVDGNYFGRYLADESE